MSHHAAIVQPQFERGQTRLGALGLYDHLIGGNADVDVRAASLLGVRSGQEAGGRAGMVAAAIAQRVGVVVHEARDHQHPILERFQRLERPRDVEGLARRLGRPVIHYDAVRHVHERRSDRGFGCRAGRRKSGNHLRAGDTHNQAVIRTRIVDDVASDASLVAARTVKARPERGGR